MCSGTSRYAVVNYEGTVLVPDAGTCYEAACEISRDIPVGPIAGHGVVNLSDEYGFAADEPRLTW